MTDLWPRCETAHRLYGYFVYPVSVLSLSYGWFGERNVLERREVGDVCKL